MRIAICGGGVIGASIACFLSRRGAEVTLVERTAVACGASGKSGGFLALDWCDGTALGPLARRSFALHAELAGTSGIDWGYRRLDSFSVVAPARGGRLRPDWLGPEAAIAGQLGSEATTAQVHPERFTNGMASLAQRHGATLVHGTVEAVTRDASGSRATGVVVNGQQVQTDAVVIAMGPWSALARAWVDLPPVYGLKGNSILLATPEPVLDAALFVELQGPRDGGTPEVFPRPDGTTYVCGLSSQQPLPADPAAVAPDPGAQAALRAMVASFAPGLAGAPVLATNACYRPVTRDGVPRIGAVPGLECAFLATGHSVWGMLNAPATGEAVAELVLDGAARTVDLRPFTPAR